jgi:drug/metabolite transporter, DME family
MFCCALSAVCYTAANSCYRQLSILQADPIWVTCIKESIAFLTGAAWVAVLALRGQVAFPRKKEVIILVLVGLVVQLVGNLGSLWAIGKIGLSITIPTNFGALLVSSALFGRVILGERVSPRSTFALGMLMAALGLLGFGAEAAGRETAAAANSLSTAIVFAIGVSCTAGVVYAVLSIAMRRAMKRSVQMSMLLFIIAGMGVATMWPMSFHRLGFEKMLATPPNIMAWIFAAGLFNVIGFLAMAKGLQLTTVVHANILNASQVAMAAVVGMSCFQEPRNTWLVLGVLVTLLGILLVDRPRTAAETVEAMV